MELDTQERVEQATGPLMAEPGALELGERLRDIEHRLTALEQFMWSGAAASREITELKTTVRDLREELGILKSKTLKWEGGGGVLYIIVTMLGGGIGWALSHIGWGH